ncbi:MAG: transcriptional regulator PpsR [Pseudomonadota bacterium]
MRTDPLRPARPARRDGDLNAHEANRSEAQAVDPDDMTSRGIKYWNTGSIPLIGPDVLGDIIASAADLAVVISDVGEVLSVLVNPAQRSFGNVDHWEGRDIRDFLTVESVPKFEAQLDAFGTKSEPLRPMELNHTGDGTSDFPIRYTLHRIGPDGALLMLGRDLRPVAEMQQQLVKAQMALERDYEARREHDTRFRVAMDAIEEAIVFVSLETGKIVEVNGSAGTLLGAEPVDVTGRAFGSVFNLPRGTSAIEAVTAASDAGTALDLTLAAGKTPVRVRPRAYRAAGTRMALLKIESAGGTASAGNILSDTLMGLFETGSEAMVFTDAEGTILSANDAFLELVGEAEPTSVRGRALADYLARGSIDVRVMADHAQRDGRMRLYSTRLSPAYGADTVIEMSATRISGAGQPVFAFVMRDATHAEAVGRSSLGSGEEGMRSVMELVGSATLKEIVAETTDVVEKMCIETAVELTNNNRVAAAEMLGLSRQSLYVKLRKYGLLSRD